MEIWDETDLAVLRESLTTLVDVERHHAIGVNMEWVKYIPGGFFGMLFNWREKGVRILLFNPQTHIRRMLWFQQFLEPIGAGCFLMLSEPTPTYQANFLFDREGEFGSDDADIADPQPVSMATLSHLASDEPETLASVQRAKLVDRPTFSADFR